MLFSKIIHRKQMLSLSLFGKNKMTVFNLEAKYTMIKENYIWQRGQLCPTLEIYTHKGCF